MASFALRPHSAAFLLGQGYRHERDDVLDVCLGASSESAGLICFSSLPGIPQAHTGIC